MDLKKLSLELIFYNVNLETAIYYTYVFENDFGDLKLDGGFSATVSRAPFMGNVNNNTSRYYTEQMILLTIKAIFALYLLFLAYFTLTRVR